MFFTRNCAVVSQKRCNQLKLRKRSYAEESKFLLGSPSSPGRFRGVIRIINEPFEANRLGPNDVLVTRYTDQNWNDILIKVPALVLEWGRMASHGPMVARREAFPCVSNLGEEMWDVVEEGAEIIVNGGLGRIEVIKNIPDHPEENK